MAVLGGVALYPVLGVGYLFWWAVFVLWLVVIGWELVRLGRSQPSPGRPA